jgi:isopentenyl diphosphate isomerase/L-lactate dehydrogenase-like FMN-dependent dehydrogenase
LQSEQQNEDQTTRGQKTVLDSVDDYEREARRLLNPETAHYVFGATESGSTLARNLESFNQYVLRRRVLQEIEDVSTRASYFDGKIQSDLPFFPGCINLSPMYPEAILDIFKLSRVFSVPIFVSEVAVVDPYEISKLPGLVSPGSSLVWQIYLRTNTYDLAFKRAKQAKEWGYKAVALTVDAERNVKLGYEIAPETAEHSFVVIKLSDIKKLKRAASLPMVVKGIMTAEDAIAAVENGADGIVVSNHGGRVLDGGEASLDVLPEIVKKLRGKKSTRHTEIFFDGGIRKGTDILKALALGARGCLLGRPLFWAIAVDREYGPERIMTMLKSELVRAALLCGVRDLSKVSPDTVRTA